MKKHTPGPWNVSTELKQVCVYGSPKGIHGIIRPLVAICDDADLSNAENEANARLIAAAPEIYEFLKKNAETFWCDADQINQTHSEPCQRCELENLIFMVEGLE